eukprot:2979986-Heterocapsa_arctica.AAC.1
MVHTCWLAFILARSVSSLQLTGLSAGARQPAGHQWSPAAFGSTSRPDCRCPSYKRVEEKSVDPPTFSFLCHSGS